MSHVRYRGFTPCAKHKGAYSPHSTHICKLYNAEKYNMLDKQVLYPLSVIGKPIYWEDHNSGRRVSWGTINFNIPNGLIDNILNNYFKDFEIWYPLGASETDPIRGGLGEYIQNCFSPLTPRHASAIAAIMVRENLIEFRGKKPIELRKLNNIFK